jgi:hypothetical protein
MQIYISEERSKKLERVSERTGDSAENALRDAVDCLDEDEDEAPQDDAGASDVPKTRLSLAQTSPLGDCRPVVLRKLGLALMPASKHP